LPIHPLLAKAREAGNPVIDKEKATFIWQGKTAPLLMDDTHNWEDDPQTMQRIGRGLWSHSIYLAKDAYIEYGFLDPKSGERVSDPLNKNRTGNGGNATNHYFYMPRGRPTPLAKRDAGAPKGTLTRIEVETRDTMVGAKRAVMLYQPPIKRPVPLVVVFDGSEYLRGASLNIIVDNLIARKRVAPFAMAMIKGGGQARNQEYSCSDSTLEFILECVFPLAQENLSLIPPERGGYGVAGASLGGLMALYAAMRLPGIFGKAICQSGAFMFPRPESVLVDLVRHAPASKIDIWMDAGKYDWLLEGNRQMFSLLKKRNYSVKYHEYSGGHNFTCWRNEIWRGLEALFRI
jgi:enterochelin esterase-like enzyme